MTENDTVNLAKDTMEKTKLWQIVRRMPKGTLLHAHCDAMVEFDYVFDVVLSTPGMHIKCPDGNLGTAARLREGEVVIQFRETAGAVDGGSIWKSEGYEAGSFVLLTEAADAFPDGGRPGFLAWLKSRCTISETDSVEQHHGVAEIWRKFVGCFKVIGSIIHYEPIWRAFLAKLMTLLVEDGVYWTEIR
jgi:adenosine deaminase CECR1